MKTKQSTKFVRLSRNRRGRRNAGARLLFLVPLLFASVVAQGQSLDLVVEPGLAKDFPLYLWKYQEGDDPAWSQLNYDDSSWTTISKEFFLPEERGIHWLRTRLVVQKDPRGTPLVLRLGRIQSAFEVYWNGMLIGTNGKVGGREEDEEPGQLHFAVPIDTVIRTGENVLSVRFSNFHQVPPGAFFYALIQGTLNPSLYNLNAFLKMVFSSAIYLACTIFGLVLYLGGGRYRNFLYYVLLSVGFLISAGFQFAMHYYNISMGVLSIFEPIYIGGFFLAEIAIVLFILFSFQIPYIRYHVLFVLLATLVCYLSLMFYGVEAPLDLGTLRNYITPYVFALLIYACLKKKSGSFVALIGYGIYSSPVIIYSYLGIPMSLELLWLRVTFILVSAMVANRQVHEQQQIQKSIELRAQRLETEFLKKTIQPHFIMNTLASIGSLAKRRPAEAEKLINALAAEFRLINAIASEKEIPIMQEIELCERHLEVMGYRWDAKYTFVKNNIDEALTVPPLIFHTLIENGITHAFNPKEDGTFRLSVKKTDDCIQYTLQNNGSLLEAMKNNAQEEVEEGTGIRYVKTRLEERYPGKWQLQYGLIDSEWNVVITVCGVQS